MKDIAIYGAGGVGRETLWLIRQINKHEATWDVKGFFDDEIPRGNKVEGLEILGNVDYARHFSGSLILAVADPSVRKKIHESLRSVPTIEYPVIIHPSCQIGDRTTHTFGQGCIITVATVLTIHVKMGMFSIVHPSTTLGHDVVLGDYVTIMPGCIVSGNVQIGDEAVLGAGSRIVQNIVLGNRCQVDAGAVVIRSFSACNVLAGVPAEIRKKNT